MNRSAKIVAITVAATSIVVPIGVSSASNMPKGMTATTDSVQISRTSVQKDAQYVIKCASELWTGCTKWDAALRRVERATRKAAIRTGNCKKKTYHGWRAGFCQLNEDDTSDVNIYRSNLGIIARAALALK